MLQALSRRLQLLFWCGGVLLCCLAVGRYIEMRHFQATENRRLEEALRAKVPAPPLPVPGSFSHQGEAEPRKPGSLVGRIEIPRLKLSAIVLEGSDSRVLNLGVGRIPETSEPGEPGNVVLGGHRDTFFRPLSGIRKGDGIKIQTPHGAYKYTVDWMDVVDPENTALLKATPQRSLTLVTCYPFHFVGPAPRRFIVRAHQDTEASAASTANPTQLPPVNASHSLRTAGHPRQLSRTAARRKDDYVLRRERDRVGTRGKISRRVRRYLDLRARFKTR